MNRDIDRTSSELQTSLCARVSFNILANRLFACDNLRISMLGIRFEQTCSEWDWDPFK